MVQINVKLTKQLIDLKHQHWCFNKILTSYFGGGIYSKPLSDIGVSFVTGIDFSEAILEGARDNCKKYENIIFKHGNALETGLDSNSYNLLLERPLIRHIEDLLACFKEGNRVLKNEGFYIIQDRTPENCLLEGNDSRIRRYFKVNAGKSTVRGTT